MTILSDPPVAASSPVSRPARKQNFGTAFVKWVTSTDHKTIGYLYLITATIWFLIAGAMALVIRAELAAPGLQFVSLEQYNQMFTMHGTVMLFLFATPLFVGFGNVIMPLQLGAPDVAFPRLNMLGYWLFFFGGITAALGFLTPGGAAAFGWFAYAPLSNAIYSPEVGGDLWLLGLAMGGLGTILGSVNFVTTIFCMRAPGMTMFRMPVFTWTILVTSILVLLCFPVLAAALALAFIDRNFGPVFSRKPIFGYKGLVFATLAIGGLSMAVWAHHLYVTGSVYLPYFAIMTMLIAVPTGVKFFNWIGTMWRGSVSFDTPMLWVMGFLITFLFGGLTGIILSAPPLDFHVSDSYFVVAHFHYTVFGTVVYMFFAGLYYWWPKMTGKRLNEALGKWHFWTMFIGFQVTFLIQHWLGVMGMPRRYGDYLPSDNFELMNQISTLGSAMLAVSMIFFIWNVFKTWATAPKVTVDDPWGWGGSLEWATSCPPPRHNFTSLPRIRSERPAFDLHHPELAAAGAHAVPAAASSGSVEGGAQ